MKHIIPLFIFVFWTTLACAEPHLTSSPMVGATKWRVQLSNGTKYTGPTKNASIWWDIGFLPTGVYRGNVSLGSPEWILTSEGKTNSTGTV